MIRFKALLLASLFCLGELSCSNQNPNPSLSPSLTPLGSGQTSVLTSSPNSVASAPNLVQALPNASQPQVWVDLIGDGSLSNFCYTAPNGPTCQCTYTYLNLAGGTQQIDTPPLYLENNLVRCDLSSVPTTVETLNLSLHVLSTDTFSNTLSYQPRSLELGLDFTRLQNYHRVIRYQCHDWITVASPFEAIPDPFLSNDPHLSYPLNFYTTQPTRTWARFTQSQSQSGQERWECPSILDPENYLTTASSLYDFYQSQQTNLTLYSLAPLQNNFLIFPSQPGQVDRSTFFLFKKSSGIFNVPLNAYHAPNLITSTGSSTDPPLGYGASPNSDETCPSISLPEGYQWVKVWLFRASLPARKYPKSLSLSNAGPILCHPGTWLDANRNTVPVFPSCDANSVSITQVSSGNPFADRIIGTSQCLGVVSNQVTADTGDVWIKRTPSNSTSDPCLSTTLPITPNFLQTCSKNNFGAFYSFQHPLVTDIQWAFLDSNGISRYDFVFVVSPPSVIRSDLLGGSSQGASNTGRQYTPTRFLSLQDCLALDPNACSTQYQIRSYAPLSKDISISSTTDPNQPNIFPLCAIQPIPNP